MAYKFDSDLEFLRQLDSNELNDLVDIIKGKEGDERITQDLIQAMTCLKDFIQTTKNI